jgi:putative ABC transport system substrate-binding protein
MKRRRFLGNVLALAGAAAIGRAQAQAKLRRIGWLTGGSPASHAKPLAAFREGLAERGWIERQNVTLELHWAEGKLDRLPALAAVLVRSKPDVILTAANVVHLAVRKETSTIPIVMATGADPVQAGLVASLARPGGNVTGISGFFEATPIKMLELLLALIPRGARVAVLLDTNFNNAVFRGRLREDLVSAARSAGVREEFLEVTTFADVERSLAALSASRPAALIVLPGSMIFANAAQVVGRAEVLGLPAVYPFEEMADAGGLMSFSVNVPESYRRAARYVDRILRGADPGALPIEQPTRLTLVVNLRAAKRLAMRLPHSLLLRADRIIE